MPLPAIAARAFGLVAKSVPVVAAYVLPTVAPKIEQQAGKILDAFGDAASGLIRGGGKRLEHWLTPKVKDKADAPEKAADLVPPAPERPTAEMVEEGTEARITVKPSAGPVSEAGSKRPRAWILPPRA